MKSLTVVLILSVITSTLPAQERRRLEVSILEGDGATNSLRAARTQDLLIQVREAGKPVEHASVTVVLPERGAGGLFVGGQTLHTDRTDSEGLVRVGGIRPRQIAGEFPIRIVASYQGQRGSAVATQTNEDAPPPSRGRFHKRNIAIFTVIAAGAAAGLVAALSDPEPGTNATGFSVSPGVVSITGPR